MQCLKCGREIDADAVFCDRCLDEMAKYPVKPDTVVLLPKWESFRTPERRPKAAPVDPVTHLKKQNRILARMLAIALLLMIGLTCGILWLLQSPEEAIAVGQNYSFIQTDSDDID